MTYKQALEIKWSLFTRQSFYRHKNVFICECNLLIKDVLHVQMSVHAEYNCVSRIDRFMQVPSIQSIHTVLLKLSSYGLFKKKVVSHAHHTTSVLQEVST